MPKYLLFMSAVFGLLTVKPIVALELGAITIGSEINQILDARITLVDIDTDDLSNWYAVTDDQDSYETQGLQYIYGLHDRLVSEIVSSANPPYIAISSIASISHGSFDLIVNIGNGEINLSETYKVVLKEPSPPVSIITRIMTPAEMLNYLINELATVQNISAAEVWGELHTMTTGAYSGGEQQLISLLSTIDLDLSFVAGITALLSEQQKTIFNQVKEESGNARAVSVVLFGQQDFLILKKLFAKATQHSLAEGITKSRQLDFAKERAAILENKIYELRYLETQQKSAEQQMQAQLALQASQSKEIRWLDYQSWLDYAEWREKPLLSNIKFWIMAAALLGILLLLLSVRLFRVQKVPPAKRTVQVGSVKAALPGQAELEKLHTPKVRINPSMDAQNSGDEIVGKLNRAEAYIEMGEREEASRLLAEVEKQSRDRLQLARMRSLQDKMR